jgi:hypothetical protein
MYTGDEYKAQIHFYYNLFNFHLKSLNENEVSP